MMADHRHWSHTSLAVLTGTGGGEAAGGAAAGAAAGTGRMSFRPRKLCSTDGVGGAEVSGVVLTAWLRAGAGAALTTDLAAGDELVTMAFEGI